MTPSQRKMLGAIARLTAAKGFAPSVREIGDALKLTSTNGVQEKICALESLGMLTRKKSTARSIRLTDAGTKEVGGVRWPLAVLAEREACAQLADAHCGKRLCNCDASNIAAAIRARP